MGVQIGAPAYPKEWKIAEEIVKEPKRPIPIRCIRLFKLNRSARSLSGGEAQRIRRLLK